MLKEMNNALCDPAGITPEQKEVNDREWRSPENWRGGIFPAYASPLDSRPFVPARMFKPKTPDDLRWVQVLCTQTSNGAHRTGRIWTFLGRAVVLILALIWLGLMVMMYWKKYGA